MLINIVSHRMSLYLVSLPTEYVVRGEVMCTLSPPPNTYSTDQDGCVVREICIKTNLLLSHLGGWVGRYSQ